MNLEQINAEYIQLKNNLAETTKYIKTLEEEVNDLADDKDIYIGKLKEGKKNGLDVSQIEEELKIIDQKLSATISNLLQKRNDLDQVKTKINEKIAEIKNNPDMLAHFQQVMTKRYNRKLAVLKHEKEETINNKDRLSSLKQLIIDHPTLRNNLKGIFSAKNAITDLQNATQKADNGMIIHISHDDSGDIDLQKWQNKLANNKKSLMEYIQKNNLSITEKDIDDLTSKPLIINEKGEFDLDTTINKEISKLNRQIKGYEKSIKHYTIAPKVLDHSINHSNTSQSSNINQQPPLQSSQEPKLKWYQFIQKFKNWNEKRLDKKKTNALPSGHQQNQNQSSSAPNSDIFKDSLKYDIVNDVLNELTETTMKKTKSVEKNIKQKQQRQR